MRYSCFSAAWYFSELASLNPGFAFFFIMKVSGIKKQQPILDLCFLLGIIIYKLLSSKHQGNWSTLNSFCFCTIIELQCIRFVYFTYWDKKGHSWFLLQKVKVTVSVWDNNLSQLSKISLEGVIIKTWQKYSHWGIKRLVLT